MNANFTISQLFNAVFGIIPQYTIPEQPSMRQIEEWAGLGNFSTAVKLKGSNAFYPKDEIVKSPLGTDIMFSFTLGGEQMKIFNDTTGELEWGYMEKFQIPVATLVDWNRGKEIVKTKVRGSGGTVKELYAFEDWSINIRGLIFDEYGVDGISGGRTAVELMRTLRAFEEFADTIPVQGWWFNEHKVSRIVINQIRFKQIEGKPWVIGFDMDCDSDNSLSLDLMAGKQYRRVM